MDWRRVLLIAWTGVLAGCTYLGGEGSCRDACQVLLEEDQCAFSLDGLSESAAINACAYECASAEKELREPWIDCVLESTCEQIESNACPVDAFEE